MVSEKRRAFWISLVASICLFGAVAMWLIPSPPTPEPEAVSQGWQAEDAVAVRISLVDGEETTSCTVCFDPAKGQITVGDAPADREAVFSPSDAVALLAECGNALPLTVGEAVALDSPQAHLQLEAGHHVLTAEQVGLLLSERPALWPEVVCAAVNAARTEPPRFLFEAVVSHATACDLSVEHYVRAHDALTHLWERNSGHLCRRRVLE